MRPNPYTCLPMKWKYGFLGFGVYSLFILASCGKQKGNTACDDCPPLMKCVDLVCVCDGAVSYPMMNECWERKAGRYMVNDTSIKFPFGQMVIDSIRADSSQFQFGEYKYVWEPTNANSRSKYNFRVLDRQKLDANSDTLFSLQMMEDGFGAHTYRINGTRYRDSLNLALTFYDLASGVTLETLQIQLLRYE